jgi:hypothetical protein
MVWNTESLGEEILGEFAEAQGLAGAGTSRQLIEAFSVGGVQTGVDARGDAGRDAYGKGYIITKLEPNDSDRRVRFHTTRRVDDAKKKDALLASGFRPVVWTTGWREAAARAGIEAPATTQSAYDAARHEKRVEARLLAGERPRQWGVVWRRAAKKLGIEMPRAAQAVST